MALINSAANTYAMDKRRSKPTSENVAESKALRTIWDQKKGQRRSQEDFGAKYGLGSQANIGHYLRGMSALNLKAAMAFANELCCEVSEFSPRIAQEMELLGIAQLSRLAALTPTHNQLGKNIVKFDRRSTRQLRIDEISEVLQGVSDEGLLVALGSLRELGKLYPVQTKETRR